MGSVARGLRADRFIKEFNSDACTRWSMSDFPGFASQSLGFDESYEVVRMFVRFENRGREEELCFPFVVYDPEWDDSSAVDIVEDMFGLEEGAAWERMVRAELVEEPR